MKLKLNWSKILIWLTYIAVFVFLIYPYADYDWGWHFRYGEYFIKTGQILRDNIYNWTLPNYKWANPSWLYDVFVYLSYIKLGFAGFSIIGAAVGLLIFIIPAVAFDLNYLLMGGLALFYVKLAESALSQGLRGQSFGLLLLCILVTLLVKAVTKPKTLFFIPLIILIWANVNGTFTLGLLIIGIFIASNFAIRIVNWIRHKPNINILSLKMLIPIFFLSVFASFVNPFSFRVYTESISHVINPWVSYVFEWSPPNFSCQYCNFSYFLIFQVILMVIFAVRKKISDLPYILTLLFLTAESYSEQRYVSMFMVTSLPIVALAIAGLKFDLYKNKITKIIYALVLTSLISVALFITIPKYHLTSYGFTDYCYYSTQCSPALADFLIKNPPVGSGFNFYDWGGFFIGRGVNAKLFIDGRMHLWSENGYMPFADYVEMYYHQDFNLFNEYNFDWVIVRNDSYLAHDLALPSIVTGTWRRVYFDNTASYFVRIKI